MSNADDNRRLVQARHDEVAAWLADCVARLDARTAEAIFDIGGSRGARRWAGRPAGRGWMIGQRHLSAYRQGPAWLVLTADGDLRAGEYGAGRPRRLYVAGPVDYVRLDDADRRLVADFVGANAVR